MDEDHLHDWLSELPTRKACCNLGNSPTAVTKIEPEAGMFVLIVEKIGGGTISGKTAEVYNS